MVKYFILIGMFAMVSLIRSNYGLIEYPKTVEP